MKPFLRMVALCATWSVMNSAEAVYFAHQASPHKMNPLLNQLVGKWKGTVRTWLQPGKLEDESTVTGEFLPVLNNRFVRHTYLGSMHKKPRHGEELLGFNTAMKVFESSWIDEYHMGNGILFSQGKQAGTGFDVLGHYEIGPGEPKWGWRTEYRFPDATHLTITAFNIMPNGEEAKAVEILYIRAKA